MEAFFEHMVKKKFDYKDFCIILIIILGAGLLSLAALAFWMYLGIFWLLIVCGIVYLSYLLITNRSIEYEYSLTNDELDIDKIRHRKRRKRLISVKCKAFDLLASVNDPAHNAEIKNTGIKKVIVAASSPYSENAYFAIFTKDGVLTLLVFEPNEKMLNTMKTFNPRKVFIS